ncbi:MAG: GTPase Era, partial [Spirochaetes bacterium]|nr:GTPase Era [Spirochaetota bacterium]
TFNEVDIVLYMIDATRAFGPEEEKLISMVLRYRGDKVIVLNKIDIPNNMSKKHEKILHETLPAIKIFNISSVTGEGISELINELMKISPEGEKQYPEDFYTDQEPVFRIAEIIREKVIHETREEIPHSVYIDILDAEMNKDSNTMWVRALIIAERDSQKGIIIGKGGSKIKTIRIAAENELCDIFPYRIKLDLRVRVKKKWRKNQYIINKLLQ